MQTTSPASHLVPLGDADVEDGALHGADDRIGRAGTEAVARPAIALCTCQRDVRRLRAEDAHLEPPPVQLDRHDGRSNHAVRRPRYACCLMRQLLRLLRQLLGLDDPRARACLDEARVAEERAMEAEQRLDSADLVLLERAEHAPPRVLAVDPVDDELREQRVVERRHLGPGLDSGVHSHARPRRLAVARDPPRCRQKARRGILGIDAALDRMAA